MHCYPSAPHPQNTPQRPSLRGSVSLTSSEVGMPLASAAGCSRGGLAEAVGPRALRGRGVSAASESLSSSSLSWGQQMDGGGEPAEEMQRLTAILSQNKHNTKQRHGDNVVKVGIWMLNSSMKEITNLAVCLPPLLLLLAFLVISSLPFLALLSFLTSRFKIILFLFLLIGKT